MSSRKKVRWSAPARFRELQPWIPVCLAAVGLVLAIALRSFLYIPAALQCSALVTAIVYLCMHHRRGHRALLAAIALVAVTLAMFFIVLPWHRDRELRVFWSDFRRGGGQVGVGGSVVLALDGQRCWNYIGVQDGLAMAAVQAGLVRMGCRPECWTVSEEYNAAQRALIESMAAQGIPLSVWWRELPRLGAERHGTLAQNTVLVGGPTANQVSLEVLGRIHGLADARNAQEGMDQLQTGYAFIMADKPVGENHGPIGYHAFGWERHEVARTFSNCQDLSSHGIAKVASPKRLAFLFETEEVKLNGEEEVGHTPLSTDYGLVVRLRHRDNNAGQWRTLILVMGWGGQGTRAAARATMDPGLVRLMNRAEADLLDKLGPNEASCTELLVRTDSDGDPELATERDSVGLPNTPHVKLENPSVRRLPWP